MLKAPKRTCAGAAGALCFEPNSSAMAQAKRAEILDQSEGDA
jgi:hypothetical protein